MLRSLRQVRRLAWTQVPVWRGSTTVTGPEALVYRLGIGPHRAAESTRAVLDSFAISALINTGCCAALAPGIRSGTVVVANRVLATEGAERALLPGTDWTLVLTEAARTAGLAVEQGAVTSSATPFLTATAKHAAYLRLGAIAGDMETATVAEMATAREIPFACARAVLDEASADLPLTVNHFSAKNGGLDLARTAFRALKEPSRAIDLLTLVPAARVCEKNLGRLFSALTSRLGGSVGGSG